MQHSRRLANAAWTQRIVTAQGRAVLVFSSLARPLAALVVTASDEQLANLVAHGTYAPPVFRSNP